jgi:hypothetical protein
LKILKDQEQMVTSIDQEQGFCNISTINVTFSNTAGETLKDLYRSLHKKKITYNDALIHVPPEVLRNELPGIPPLLTPIPTDFAKPSLI